MFIEAAKFPHTDSASHTIHHQFYKTAFIFWTTAYIFRIDSSSTSNQVQASRLTTTAGWHINPDGVPHDLKFRPSLVIYMSEPINKQSQLGMKIAHSSSIELEKRIFIIKLLSCDSSLNILLQYVVWYQKWYIAYAYLHTNKMQHKHSFVHKLGKQK